jgi:hypothetical protein
MMILIRIIVVCIAINVVVANIGCIGVESMVVVKGISQRG